MTAAHSRTSGMSKEERERESNRKTATRYLHHKEHHSCREQSLSYTNKTEKAWLVAREWRSSILLRTHLAFRWANQQTESTPCCSEQPSLVSLGTTLGSHKVPIHKVHVSIFTTATQRSMSRRINGRNFLCSLESNARHATEACGVPKRDYQLRTLQGSAYQPCDRTAESGSDGDTKLFTNLKNYLDEQMTHQST